MAMIRFVCRPELTSMYADVERLRAELAALRAERDALRNLVTLMQERAKEGFRAWDADKDAKAGKVLAALAGMKPGYWPDMDNLHASINAAMRAEG
jgi:hypothetical protein